MAAALLILPATAAAHGPTNPAASRWQARVTHVPAGLHVEAIDGDLRLWLRANPTVTVEVIDYRGAPYLRFSPAGVFVNRNSAMWYVNQIPRLTPPISLGPRTPPRWQRISNGHSYLWQDGRLQALSRTVLSPGSNDAGRWSIPLSLNGRPAQISGRLYRWPSPSPVWFWPIVVALACTVAGLRLRRAALDRRMARVLGLVALAGIALSATGRQLHGRPAVTVWQIIVLALELLYCGWALGWLVRGRPGWLTFLVIAMVALWEGISLVSTLIEGDALLATGPLPARLGDVACLSAGLSLLPIAIVMAERGQPGRRRNGRRTTHDHPSAEDEGPPVLATPTSWDSAT
ncbi:MAG TPA: hypothetical protein VGL69_01975 [Solirubrobacteraceae bacterium]